MLLLDDEPITTPLSEDTPGLDHVVCRCDMDLALCGADVTDDVYDDSDWWADNPPEDMCVVCLDLSEPDSPDCRRCRA